MKNTHAVLWWSVDVVLPIVYDAELFQNIRTFGLKIMCNIIKNWGHKVGKKYKQWRSGNIEGRGTEAWQSKIKYGLVNVKVQR